MVEISVNRVRKHLIGVDAGGSFAASAPLNKRMTLLDLSAPNPNLLVTSCAPLDGLSSSGTGRAPPT
jgi:hypothetical protein